VNTSNFTQIDTAIITANFKGAESNIICIKNLHIVATHTSPSASPPRASPVAENGCNEKYLYPDGRENNTINHALKV
jgi:hypothetical protein